MKLWITAHCGGKGLFADEGVAAGSELRGVLGRLRHAPPDHGQSLDEAAFAKTARLSAPLDSVTEIRALAR